MSSSNSGARSTGLPSLVSSNRLESIAVLSRDGDKLGAVGAFLTDRFSGQVEHVAVAMGGMLGIGTSYHPVPWRLLDFDPNRDGYVISIERAVLSSGPSFKSGAEQLFDAAYTDRVLSYFGVSTPVLR